MEKNKTRAQRSVSPHPSPLPKGEGTKANMDNDRHINFKLLRDRILGPSDQSGQDARAPREYWRSLEELADSPIFEEFVQREFPHAAEEWNDPVERRTFLKLMGASLALESRRQPRSSEQSRRNRD